MRDGAFRVRPRGIRAVLDWGSRHQEISIPLQLEETAISLLAHAGFVTIDAGMLTLVGPPGQEANIAVFAGDFLLSVRVGVSPAPAVAWGEDHDGLKLFLKAVLGRQSGR